MYTAPCDNLDRFNTDTGANVRLLRCADRIAISQDGTRAAVGGKHGIAIIDMATGVQTGAIDLGEPAFPVTWSPSGRWLQWAACGSENDTNDPCKIAIGSADGGVRNRLPGGGGGGFFIAQWSPDESQVVLPDGAQGLLIGNADGSDLKPLPDDSVLATFVNSGYGYNAPAAVSPDGGRFAYAWGPYVNGHTPVMDLWTVAADGTDRRNLTNFEPGAQVRGVAWSPDGRTTAFIKGLPGSDGRLPSSTVGGPNELWLIGEDGSMRRLDTPSDLFAASDAGTMPLNWSPDGSTLAIEIAGGAVSQGKAPTSIDTILVPIDGSTPVVLRNARQPAWSPDGQLIALVTTIGWPSGRRENDPVPPATIDVANADGSNRHVVADPAGNEDFWFVWAAP